uniref:AsIV-cont00066-ORF1 n=1 Tax=Apophua simplicipes ichnovirus TaxID=1329648 RepID=S5DYV8_9VIRU|nr:AsIV-cont00066-ORF1 [Apophua simplicipes ichnovirus]
MNSVLLGSCIGAVTLSISFLIRDQLRIMGNRHSTIGNPYSAMRNPYSSIASTSSESSVSLGHEYAIRDPEVLRQEYEAEVEGAAIGPWQTTVAFDDPVNRMKNRWCDVPCWDHSRVILKNSSSGSDYIHANWIDGFWRNRKFIATQSPKFETVDDYFDMIDENKCRVIVVLTKIFDDYGDNHAYWSPNFGCRISGRYVVWTVKTKDKGDYKVFGLKLENLSTTKRSRKVTLYHYDKWPEHGTPANIDSCSGSSWRI